MADGIFPNGSTLTFPGFSSKVQQIGGYKEDVAVADITPISQAKSSHKLKLFSQRKGHEAIEVQFFFNPSNSDPSIGVVQDLVITFTDLGYQLYGRAAVTSYDFGNMASDEVIIGTMMLEFEGGDGSGRPIKSSVV